MQWTGELCPGVPHTVDSDETVQHTAACAWVGVTLHCTRPARTCAFASTFLQSTQAQPLQ